MGMTGRRRQCSAPFVLIGLLVLAQGTREVFGRNIQLDVISGTKQELENIRVQSCGEHLAELISTACRGAHNSPEQSSEESSSTTAIYRTRREAHRLLEFKKRRRRGVSDECCNKPCSYNELSSFCSTPSPLD